MAIRIRGSIVIDRKHGRRGDFSVGELTTEIGVFEVKDALLDQFEPGTYTGDFLVSRIEPDSFAWRGRVYVKVVARLAEIFVDDASEETPAPATPPEPDPIDSAIARTDAVIAKAAARPTPAPPMAAPTAAPVPAPVPASTSVPPATAKTETERTDEDQLFGAELALLVKCRSVVKLDATVDRQLLRAQCDRLKALGYRFDAKTQTWYHAEALPA